MASVGDECSVPKTLFSTAEGGTGTGTGIVSGEIKTSSFSDEVAGRATGICFLIWFW